MVYDALQTQTCFKDYKVLSGGRVRGGHQDLNYLPGVLRLSVSRALPSLTPPCCLSLFCSQEGSRGLPCLASQLTGHFGSGSKWWKP